MPVTTKGTKGGKKPSESKVTGNAKSGAAKQAGAVKIKTTSAREKAKNFDEGRRNDANSNEL